MAQSGSSTVSVSIIEIQIEAKVFRINTTKGFDLSIPLHFTGEGLSAFGVSPAAAQTVENNWFVGDTRRGGSCNVEEYTLIPHCQGTHTECLGHIVNENVPIREIVKDPWIPATVLSVELEKSLDCMDRYDSAKQNNDDLVSKNRLLAGLEQFTDRRFQQALIIRTLPNNPSKKTLRYTTAPYFSNDVMEEIVRRGIQHLLVDLPSVDRMEDEGRLSNHRIFWEIPPESHALGPMPVPLKTITELIFVPDQVKDGYYLLNLQIPPFMSDAAPSRPLIFPLEPQ